MRLEASHVCLFRHSDMTVGIKTGAKKSNSQHFIGIKDAIHVGQVQSVPHLSNGEQSSFVEQVDLP